MRTRTVALLLAAAAALAAGRARRLRLAGKVALVSGGSRGLGLVIARVLAARGARVALLARDAGELERARADLIERGTPADRVVVATADVADARQVDEAVRTVIAAWGGVDVLVNAAGVIEVGPFASMEPDALDRAMAINFRGAMNLVQAVLPSMRRRHGGRIVQISSIGGVVPVPHLLPYVASKFALTGASLALRAELAKDGIVVVTVCPGLMRTGSTDHATFTGNAAREHAWFAASDSLPLLSTSAERAARRVVRALERGEAHVLITPAAKLAALAQGLAPGLVARMMTIADRLLPRGGSPAPAREGRRVRSPRLPAWLTALGDRAAARNNETAR